MPRQAKRKYSTGGRTITVYLSEELLLQVEKVADKVHDSRNGVIVNAIRGMLLEQEKNQDGK